MFAALVGWMIVTPDGWKVSRAKEMGLGDDALPALSPAETLQDHWFNLGQAEAGSQGPMPLRWSEIEAYARIMGLRQYECETLRKMSDAFVSELSDRSAFRKTPIERAGIT